MRPVQCAPRGSSYAISLHMRVRVVCSVCRFVWLCCVLRVGETVSRAWSRGDRNGAFRYGTGRSSRATKRFGVQPVLFVYSNIVVLSSLCITIHYGVN